MAASRLLRAVAAFVILLSFAAGSRKSYWSGCMKAATVICQQIFFILALVIFLSQNPFQKCFKIVFFSLWRRDPSGFGATISDAVVRSSVVFCNSVSADRIVMAASRLLRAVAAFVIVFCSWISEIVLEWLHEGCDSDLSADFLHFGASDFLSKNPFKKCFKIVIFSLWRRESGFGVTISDAVACSSVVFSNSVSADRIVMAASRLLRAVAAFVILLSFAAGSRKSYWSGCMKAATVICQQIFSILALVIFLLKIHLKSASKSSFFRSGVKIRFWSYNFRRRCA